MARLMSSGSPMRSSGWAAAVSASRSFHRASASRVRTTAGGLPPARLSVHLDNLDHHLLLRRVVERGPAGYLLEDLPPGTYDASIGVEAPAGDEAFLVPVDVLLRATPGKVAEREILLVQGGSFDVAATGFDEALVAPRCFVRDAGGRVIGQLAGTRAWSPGETKGPAVPLEPGRYSVSVAAAGFRTWRGTVEVHAGERTRVEAALVAAD